ncbi:PAS domain-containing protein [Cryomorphaceae bacterium 1068]|nr:PAS domain-containing protein [Cryomorphaceae bacterium 1068]
MKPIATYYCFRLESDVSAIIRDVFHDLKKPGPESTDDPNKLNDKSFSIVYYNADIIDVKTIIRETGNIYFIAICQNHQNGIKAIENGAADYIQLPDLNEFSISKSLILTGRFIEAHNEFEQTGEYGKSNLLLTEKKYRTLVETISNGVWEYDKEKSEITWSDSLYQILGYAPNAGIPPAMISELAHPDHRQKIRKEMSDHLDRGLPYESEFPVIKNDGNYIWVRAECNGIKDGNGEVMHILGSVKNIDLRKRAELDLANTQNRIENIADGINGVLARYRLRPDGVIENLYLSSGAKEMWGLKAEEVISNPRSVWNLLDESQYNLLASEFRSAICENKKLDHVYSFTDSEGNEKHLHVIAIPKRFEDGTIEWDSITTDVTALKNIEDESNDQQLMLQNIISNIDGFVQRHKIYPDGKSELAFISKGYERLSGISVSEIMDNNELVWDQINEEDRQAITNSVEHSLKTLTKWQQTWRIINRNGELKWIQGSGTPNQQKDGSIIFDTVTTEITQLIDITTELTEARREFRLAAKAAHLGLWKYDPIKDTLEWDDQMFEIFGVDPKKFSGKRQEWVDSLHPDDKAKSINALTDTVNTGTDLEFQFRILRKDNNEIRHIRASANAILDKNGEVVFLVGLNWDVTHLVRAQEKIKESNNRYALASKATQDAIWDLDIKTNILKWNASFNELFGHEIDLDKDHLDDWAKLVHPDDYERVVLGLENFIKSSQNKWEERYRFKKGDGEYAHVHDRGFIVRDHNGIAIRMVGAMRDVSAHTEFLNAIEAQNEKLKRIAWTQSHELRGPLTRIMGLTTMVEQDGFKDISIEEFLSYLKTASAELDEVIKEIVDASEEVGIYVPEEKNASRN